MRTDAPAGVTATAALQRSTSGGSASFLVLADDGNRYWCKVLDNPQGDRVPINEQLVARLGSLIGAPVCTAELVYMPGALAGWEYRNGTPLVEGWAHGSLAVEPVVETRVLQDRALDNNARRHAGIYALYDWVGGNDPQWLVRSDSAYFSHDHGHYLPGGPAWTEATLQAAASSPFELGVPPLALDADELDRLAAALTGVTEEEIAACASKVPAQWPVSDAELDAVVAFVFSRRLTVAGRLRALSGAV